MHWLWYTVEPCLTILGNSQILLLLTHGQVGKDFEIAVKYYI